MVRGIHHCIDDEGARKKLLLKTFLTSLMADIICAGSRLHLPSWTVCSAQPHGFAQRFGASDIQVRAKD
jgi:hypothetical protein